MNQNILNNCLCLTITCTIHNNILLYVSNSDLPYEYFRMRNWKQKLGILGKSEDINRITVTNEILEAAFVVVHQFNQTF